MTAARPIRQRPEPGRGWVAWAAASWRCGPELWTDVANGAIEGHRKGRDVVPDFDLEAVDDLLYLPPVRDDLAEDRDRRALAAIEREIPVLVQLGPGQLTAVPGARLLIDLLPALVTGRVEDLAVVPEGADVVWPLVPGLTDRLELQEEGCELLAARGVRCVLVTVPEISSALRRRLGEISEEVFDALFHSGPISERELVQMAHRHGLEPFLPREPVGNVRQVRNRRIAEVLTLTGEIAQRLGDPVAEAQAFLRAARGAESSSRDLVALTHEGNLRVIDWLDARTRELVEDWVDRGEARRLSELLERYLEGPR